jgi:spore coat protein JB
MACNSCNNFNNSNNNGISGFSNSNNVNEINFNNANNSNGIAGFNNINNTNGITAFNGSNNNGCPCSNNSNQQAMLMQIRCLRFSINDLALYLDTHPCDRRALAVHNEYARELRTLTNNYQRMYGPLDIECPCNQWRWIDEPWPWERS